MRKGKVAKLRKGIDLGRKLVLPYSVYIVGIILAEIAIAFNSSNQAIDIARKLAYLIGTLSSFGFGMYSLARFEEEGGRIRFARCLLCLMFCGIFHLLIES